MVEFLCRINFNGRINLTTTRTTKSFICKAIKELQHCKSIGVYFSAHILLVRSFVSNINMQTLTQTSRNFSVTDDISLLP